MHQYHISTLKRESLNLKETSECHIRFTTLTGSWWSVWKKKVIRHVGAGTLGLGRKGTSLSFRSSGAAGGPTAAEASLITLHRWAVQLSRTQLKRICCKGERARSPQTPARLKYCRCTEIREFGVAKPASFNLWSCLFVFSHVDPESVSRSCWCGFCQLSDASLVISNRFHV